jgi:hypothetical protein
VTFPFTAPPDVPTFGAVNPTVASESTVFSIVRDLRLNEGNSSSQDFEFTVNRSGNLDQQGSVEVIFAAGDTDAADFGGSLPQVTRTVTFGVGDPDQPVRIEVFGDTDVESDETFSLTLRL